jgi:hypothetical protein
MAPGPVEPYWSDNQGPDRAAAGATEVAAPRLERHAADLRTRPRPACQDWDAAGFEPLVQRVARTTTGWRADDS